MRRVAQVCYCIFSGNAPPALGAKNDFQIRKVSIELGQIGVIVNGVALI